MTPNDERAEVQIGADLQHGPPANELGDSTFRLLILGEFGGANADRQPLATRVIHRIDRDGLDAVMAAIAPTFAFSIDANAAPELISFSELDDFHPDRLLTNAPMLARLRALRTTIESRPDATLPRPSGAITPDTRSLLDRMLDAEPALPPSLAPAPSASAGDDLDDFVRRAVRPHVARAVDPQQHALVAQVDDVISATLRVLLHDARFQALEALWRATDMVLRRCDLGDGMTIGLLDVTRAEVAAMGASAERAAAFQHRLSSGDGGAAWSIAIAAYEFGPNDVALLSTLASVAEASNTPVMSAAHSRMMGASTFADNGDADEWEQAPIPGWDDLRRTPAARFVSLALPRFLVRLPYGAENPVESLSFEELPAGAHAHDSFLWGNSAFLCGVGAATPLDRGMPAPSSGTIGGLPLHVEKESGEALPCTEVLLSQRTLMHMLERGLTPLASQRDGDAVRIPRLQSIADPPAALPFRPAVRS